VPHFSEKTQKRLPRPFCLTVFLFSQEQTPFRPTAQTHAKDLGKEKIVKTKLAIGIRADYLSRLFCGRRPDGGRQ